MKLKIPLYYQVEEDLRKKIYDGVYNTGQPLPSEKELIKIYGVSRLTIREAVNRLVLQGLVKKEQGKGTFIAEPKVAHRVGSLFSSGEEFLARKFEIKTKVLLLKRIKPDKVIREKLKISDDEEVIFLNRLRYADNKPATLIESYLPYRYVEGIESIDFTKCFLYRTLEDHFKLQLYEAEECIEAINIDFKSSNLLELEIGTPLLLIKRLTYLIDGKIIEYDKVLYRSDIFEYHVKLEGRGQGRLV